MADETIDGTFTIRDPNLFTNLYFSGGEENKTLLTLTADGRMIIGEGLSMDDATQQVAAMLVEKYGIEMEKYKRLLDKK